MQYPPDNQNPWSSPPPPSPSLYNGPTMPYGAPYLRQGTVPPQQPFPQRPPTSTRRFRLWWGRQRKITQAGLGCGCLVVGLLLCSVFAAIGNAATAGLQTNNTPTATVAIASPSPTSMSNAVATSNVPATPTSIPTDTPTPLPTPTAQPTTPATAPTAKPTTPPTSAPVPTPTPTPSCQAVNNNPWCYNFSPGNLIYSPPAAFCSYFSCISSFWNGHGYVMECQDGMYSKSGGITGSCSRHGGDKQPLYSH